ncbi:hypothetical protein ACMC56_08765 [Campylobacterota bacterium DY0563]
MNKNEIKTIKSPLLSEHGTYMFGQLSELAWTVAGSGIDEQGKPFKYGHSVKLKFIVTKIMQKELNGKIIDYPNTVFEYLNISCETEEEIESKYAFYDQFRGQEILVPIINNKEKVVYKIDDEKLLIIDKKSA